MIYSLSLGRLLWKYTVMCMLLSRGILQVNCKCKVLVSEPWPMPLLVPQDAYVLMNCTAGSHLSPVWSIDLANDSSSVQFQFGSRMELLNSHGFYELPKIEMSGTVIILRLLVNETTRNNETVIYCSHNSAPYTTLSVFEPAQLMLEVSDIKSDAINITWHHESEQTVRTFSLTITYGSHVEVIPLSESYHYFTAPEAAPSCEVYNFSVTATQYDIVGATYTGAGCSVHSSVLSRMLPSLPDIEQVESTLSYVLIKQSNGGLVLQVLFTPPTIHCPSHIYTLVVILNESVSCQQLFLQAESTMVANVTPDNLQDNVLLNFKIQVRNSLSETFEETHITNFYTTDVQNITVAVISDHSVPGMVKIQCDFIPGSDAQGCIVILVGESHNTTLNLTRIGNLLTTCGSERLPMTASVKDVFGFDIESDGTIGTTQVPGIITSVASSTEFDTLCQPKETNPLPRTEQIILTSSVAAVLAMVLFIVASAITIICWYSRKSSAISKPYQPPAAVNSYITNHEEMDEVDDQQQDTMPYYDQPQLIISSLSNESDYSRTSHTLQVSPILSNGSESTTYSRLQDSQEHAYHVLENTNRLPHCHEAFYSCPDSRPDIQPSGPPPIYYTIHDERPVEEQLYAQVPSSPLQSANNQSQETEPIYQELSVSTTTGPITTQMSPTVVRTVV